MSKSHQKNKWALFFLLLSALILIVLANLIPKIQLYVNRSSASALISFPRDYNAHPSYNSEWWYLNLITNTSENKQLDYVISFSRILGNFYLLSSRNDKTNSTFAENTNSNGKITSYLKNNKYLFLNYENSDRYMILQEMPQDSDRKRIFKLNGRTPEIGTFNLVLKERTAPTTGVSKPLLWGEENGSCIGKISVFKPNDTFYYSIPDLDISGKITDINGSVLEIKSGKAWIDHQWFNSSPPPDWKGHYWTNMHFTETDNLFSRSNPDHAVGFVTQIYDSGPKYSYWVKRNPNGNNRCGNVGNLNINNYGSTNFPNNWNLNLNLNNQTFLTSNGKTNSDNQIFQLPIGPRFTEASSAFNGTIFGRNFTGVGFFETHLTRPQ